ncbi:MAG TPA: ribonuclease III [Planctomycetota bacterium]|nr:ribonuclease III [Planctomycetota bacterium]
MNDRSQAPRDARRRLLRALQKDLGHVFEDLGILDRALTHASTGNEGRPNYERLEFLGDAFLNFAVADELFAMAPEIPEGRLTETRATLVSRRPLAAVARQLDLVRHLEVGKGLKDNELDSERILADLVEAVLGAIYQDGGVRAARKFVNKHIMAQRVEVVQPGAADAKTRLLHFCQHHRLGQPKYELLETIGLQHEQEFRIAARLHDGRYAEGRGRNKRAAEKQAAEALYRLVTGGERADGLGPA